MSRCYELLPPPNTQTYVLSTKEEMNPIICMSTIANLSTSLKRFVLPAIVPSLFVLGLLVISGCSSGNSSAKPQVGAIAFTDANATPIQKPLASLTVSQGTYLAVALTNDTQLLGADWSVSCGSAPAPGTPLPPGQIQDESCGTFTPAHTMSGPVPSYVTSATGYVALYTAPAIPPKEGTVTLYASASSNHTRFSSVTLTVNGLPISVGFAPSPPPTLGLSASTQFKAVLSSDSSGAGVKWTVICGSNACGSFSPAQTASGVVTTYTAPASVPTGGTVLLTATAIADPTKSFTATVQIVPVSVSVTPATPSVSTAGLGSITAIVAGDGANKGVDWSVRCTNAMTPGNCGTITSHTASGATATYTAPSVASIAVGSTIVITATSTTDSRKSAISTVTTIKGNLVAGESQAGRQPVTGAQVTLYAAATSESVMNIAANAGNASAVTTATTDQSGSFSIPYGYECPTPDTQMYLVSTGGNAGGGTNPDMALMAALGPCSRLEASRFVVNEATTAAAVYALSGFMSDATHVGASNASPFGVATAFATAKDLVDVTTGLTRTRTVSGMGMTPESKINTLANMLSACAQTAGSSQGDGSLCDQLFSATNPGTSADTQASNTVKALLDLARNATGFPSNPGSFAVLNRIALLSASFAPANSLELSDWMLAIQFPSGLGDTSAALETLSSASLKTLSTSPDVDLAGNVWVSGSNNTASEFVGAAACKAALKTLSPIAAGSANNP